MSATSKLSLDLRRFRFLRAIERKVPRVLDDLRLVVPVFKGLFEVISLDDAERLRSTAEHTVCYFRGDEACFCLFLRGHPRPASFGGPTWGHDFADHPDNSSRQAVRLALLGWSTKYKLRDSWILEFAVDALQVWALEELGLARSFSTGWPADSEWSLSAWDESRAPVLRIEERWCREPWSRFDTKIRKQIKDFRQAVDEYSIQIGYDPEASGNSLHHYEWLALYQCADYSTARIWDDYADAAGYESTVTKAVHALASAIGLTLRAGLKRGAKRKLR